MTLRGYTDVEAEGLIAYAGTSTWTSQKVVTSEVVCRGWSLTAIDVKKAFVKGITYEVAPNEPPREVNFELDADAVAARRQPQDTKTLIRVWMCCTAPSQELTARMRLDAWRSN